MGVGVGWGGSIGGRKEQEERMEGKMLSGCKVNLIKKLFNKKQIRGSHL